MRNILLILLAALVLVFVGGGIYLLMADIPAPTQRVEKTIDDTRFPE